MLCIYERQIQLFDTQFISYNRVGEQRKNSVAAHHKAKKRRGKTLAATAAATADSAAAVADCDDDDDCAVCTCVRIHIYMYIHTFPATERVVETRESRKQNGLNALDFSGLICDAKFSCHVRINAGTSNASSL